MMQIVVDSAKKGYSGQHMNIDYLKEQLIIFEKVELNNELQIKYPFTCFGAIIDDQTN